jgi:RNA-splicing ligase RtcB
MNIQGKYNIAKVFTENIEEQAINQIKELLDQEFIKDLKIRIMPDAHAGAGCVIGTTMTIKDKIVPNLVGVDVGCGVQVVKIEEKDIDFNKLDKVIRQEIPSGFNVRNTPHPYVEHTWINKLKCLEQINLGRAQLSIGTLGSGNHFSEVDKNDKGELYLVVHSGSRHLGKQMADYYQKLAGSTLTGIPIEQKKSIKKKLEEMGIPKDLAYLEGENLEDYLFDMKIVQQYAVLNRMAIIDTIVEKMELKVIDRFESIHNYIDLDNMILRKGAVSAKFGQRLIIPINMRDGSLICVGKGNPDWNYSAPHGAGRVMGRKQAKKTLSLNDYKQTMAGIYTTSVNEDTIDEAPMAYKPIGEIEKNIQDTVEILERIYPIYNFKAS